MDLKKIIESSHRKMPSIDCKTAFKKFQNILTSKLNEFLPQKTGNQRSGKTSNHVKNAATRTNAFKQFWMKEE